jgi:hypothetical protein
VLEGAVAAASISAQPRTPGSRRFPWWPCSTSAGNGVPAKEFTSFNWLPEKGGSLPAIYAGNGFKDRVRDAVQRLSTDTIERTVRTHTGWRLINGAYAYLHGGGAIGGAANVEVDLPSQLSAFNIPTASPDQIVAGISGSLELLDLAPDHIMVPLYCSIWRAAMGPCDWSHQGRHREQRRCRIEPALRDRVGCSRYEEDVRHPLALDVEGQRLSDCLRHLRGLFDGLLDSRRITTCRDTGPVLTRQLSTCVCKSPTLFALSLHRED